MRRRSVCPVRRWAGSDCSPDVVERRGEAQLRVGFGSEFVVVAVKVPHECATIDDQLRRLGRWSKVHLTSERSGGDG